MKDAQEVRIALVKALTRAHDDRKHGGMGLADAESSFWTETEGTVLQVAGVRLPASTRGTDESDAVRFRTRGERWRAQFDVQPSMIFYAHVTLSEFDPENRPLRSQRPRR